VLGNVNTDDNEIVLCHHPLPSLLGSGSKPLQLFGLRKTTGAVPRSDRQALPPLGRYGLSSSDGRFCENRPFAHFGRFCGHKGRFAIVTDVGRDAVDVGGALTNALACGRRSRVVLTPRRWRSSWRRQ